MILGLLMGTGDVIAQTVVEQKSLKNINILRTGQFTFIGLCFVVSNHNHYQSAL